jgi:DNA-binding MarR family transcriptional regulator
MAEARHAKRGTARPARTAAAGDPPADHESRATDDHHQSLRLWLRLMTCTQLIEAEVRSRLRRDFGITLPRFDLLAQLERHPQGLRMGELSRRMMVTSGNVTGITDQLVGEGWVKRVETPDDRRAYLVRLTPAGKRAFDRMAAAHEEWVIGLLGGMSGAEQQQLSRLLGKVKQNVTQAAAATAGE